MFERKGIRNETTTLSNPAAWLIDSLGGESTSSGETINNYGALNLSVVYSCVNIRANTIAKMPLHVYKKVKEGKERVTNDISELLEVRPNPYMTPFVFKHTISCHVDLWGNAYVWMESNRGTTVALWVLDPSVTSIYLDNNNQLWYITNIRNNTYKFKSEEVLHLKALSTDGIIGKSRITIARETLGNIKAAQKLLGKFYANGTTAKGIITYADKLEKDTKENIRNEWMKANSGLNNAGKVAIMDMGLDYKTIGMNFEDAQFIQLTKFGVEEIARIYNVPLHMLNSLDRSTFNNIQQQSLDFISNSIQPTLTDWEEEVRFKAFSTQQKKQGYYVKFNMTSALRADDETRAKFYKEMLGMGVYSINDVLELEDKNTIGEAGDKHRVSLNYVDVGIADKYQLSKANSKGGEVVEE